MTQATSSPSSIVKDAPMFSPEQASQLTHDLFGITGSAKALPSERDQNFLLTTDDRQRYVLKIANSREDKASLEFQNQAMKLLAKTDDQATLPFPKVVPNLDGADIATVKVESGQHFVRLLTYLQGKPLALAKPHSDQLLQSLGRMCATMDLAWQDFDHPAAHREFHWDLMQAEKIVSELSSHIANGADQAVVIGFLERFQSQTVPRLATLRTGIIHNDANDYNVLVGPLGDWDLEVCGLIDFGDMVAGRIVHEPAVAGAYAMLHKTDPLAAAASVVAGYHSINPLTGGELEVVFDLMCMRLCMSVCHAAHQSVADPENDYLLISQKQAWDMLHKLSEIHPNEAHYIFRQACGLEPVPHSPKLVQWLNDHADDFAPVIKPNLNLPGQMVLDLSVSSPLVAFLENLGDPSSFTDFLERTMAEAGVEVAIGRWDEARLVYASENFISESEELPERRTIHLGVDLYMKAGTGIMAFMTGKVHSFNNNEGWLDYGPTIILEHQTDDGLIFHSLYGHLSLDSIENLTVGQTISKGQMVAKIGSQEVNGGWPPHVHFQIITDMMDQKGHFLGVGRPQQRELYRSLCPDPTVILGINRSDFPAEGRSSDQLLTVRKDKLGPNLSISYDQPLKIVKGKGQYLFSNTGQRYTDGVNNVCHVGHCHPKVVQAGQQQMAVLNTNTRYLHDNIVDFAEKLLGYFPDELSVVYFVCSGSEANELALRLARTYTGQTDLLTLEGAYHGNTQGLVDISPYKNAGPGGKGAPPWVHNLVMPDGYRGPHKGLGLETGQAYGQYLKEAVAELKTQGRSPAAFICESMLGCGGQVVLPDGYMASAFEHVRAGGGLCIADEVQVGFGRAGSHFWAFETQNVVPDIVTLGKPIGNGHPLAAVVTKPEIAQMFNNGMEYFNTFGGNPVSCAIGKAVLEVIEDEGLQQNAFEVGQNILEGLRLLQEKYDLIGNVRGLGLYIGAELVLDRHTLEPAPDHASHICNRLKEHGFLMSTDGPLHNVLKLKPPICFTNDDAHDMLAKLDKIMGEDRLLI